MEAGLIERTISMPASLYKEGLRPFGISKSRNGKWFIAVNNAITCLDDALTPYDFITGLPENLHQLCYDPTEDVL
jgi:hypothetical protein